MPSDWRSLTARYGFTDFVTIPVPVGGTAAAAITVASGSFRRPFAAKGGGDAAASGAAEVLGAMQQLQLQGGEAVAEEQPQPGGGDGEPEGERRYGRQVQEQLAQIVAEER